MLALTFGTDAEAQAVLRAINLVHDRVEGRLDTPLPPGRSRVNCTLPGPQGRWYWYGTQFYVKRR